MRDTHFEIRIPKGTKIAVVGDIHEHEEQFDKLLETIRPSPTLLLASVGDVYDKGGGLSCAESITDKLNKLGAYAVKGNHELKHLRKNKFNLSPQLQWWAQRPLVLTFIFCNNTRLTIVHGGVKPSHTWDDLTSDVEVAYMRDIDEKGKMIRLDWATDSDGQKKLKPHKPNGVSWHTKYDGRFGYIAAGHEPLKDGKPKYYNFSCNLDTACYDTGILTCQVFDEKGLYQLHTITGSTFGINDGLIHNGNNSL